LRNDIVAGGGKSENFATDTRTTRVPFVKDVPIPNCGLCGKPIDKETRWLVRNGVFFHERCFPSFKRGKILR